ncbi:methyltransferase domain-containing protein [Streptomyces sp. AS58]|uniref:methyltransferase domain-containing protein n=1 Tax=Streptomyces sp. AS58 TaxID=1519489 RepID=UPI000B2E84D4|nr:methyltransferase domain-containing protein [Streptomyces sp. AS58]
MKDGPAAQVLALEHTPQRGTDAVRSALESAGLAVRACRMWAGDPVPDTPDGAAALVVLGGPADAQEDLSGSAEVLALVRAALEAEVPLLAVGQGAHLLAVAAGGKTLRVTGPGIGCGGVRRSTAADPVFTGFPAQPAVPHRHRHRDTIELPARAVLLASCDRDPAQAFRIGGSAWGVRWCTVGEDERVDASEFVEPATAAPARLAGHCAGVSTRFAALVAARAVRTATRTYFTPRAATWEERFAADNPAYAAAVARMGLRPGLRALDVGCGSGRALPALRAEVGERGLVLGVDVTPAMLTAGAAHARHARLLLADAGRLPLSAGAVDGVFSAGLINHVPDPAAALAEWARVTAPSGVLLLFHPSGRAERAARHGRPLDPDDPLAEEKLRPALEAAGWRLDCYEDARHHFLARAVRGGG